MFVKLGAAHYYQLAASRRCPLRVCTGCLRAQRAAQPSRKQIHHWQKYDDVYYYHKLCG